MFASPTLHCDLAVTVVAMAALVTAGCSSSTGGGSAPTPRVEARPPSPALLPHRAPPTAPASSAYGDLDRDGFVDLLIGRTEGPPPNEVADVHHVDAQGIPARPSASIRSSEGCGLGPLPVFRLGDLDGDGYGDLGVARAGGLEPYVTVVHGGPRGTPTRLTRIDAPVRGAPSCFGQAMAAADVDADGRLELVVSAPMLDGERGGVYVYRDLGAPPVETLLGPVAGGRFGTALGLRDLGGDARPELVVGVPEESARRGAVHVLARGPQGFEGPGRRIARTTGAEGERFGARIATVAGPPGARVLVGWTGGVAALGSAGVTDLAAIGSVTAFALGDVTGDGAADAVACDDATLRVYPAVPEGFARASIATLSLSADERCAGLAVPGDLDRDGYGDVVAGIARYAGRGSEVRIHNGAPGGLVATPRVIAGAGSMSYAHWVR